MKKLKKLSVLFVLILFVFACGSEKNSNEQSATDDMAKARQEYAIVIHGGAGNATTKNIPPEKQEEYKAKLQEALDKGVAMLEDGAKGLDVIESVIHILEDCPLFNAGKGAVFTHDGRNEMDASIMDGKTLQAGAVASVGDIKHPISAAYKVMTNSEHVLLAGRGASIFAEEQGLEIVDSSYFYTESRWNALQRMLKAEKHGTVGCVVLDKEGNLAAGTSTGGRSNKKYGRIGDSPIIGAGTYANNATCAVSATGHGEYFMRYVVAYQISALMEFNNMSLEEASNKVINEILVDAGGIGGIIAVDHKGNISMPFNSNMMFRAYAQADGEKGVLIFKE